MDRIRVTPPCLIVATDDDQGEIKAFAAPENGTDYTLDELKTGVGGWIELVDVPGHADLRLVVDESGRLKGKAENWVASALAGQSIVGDAVLIYDRQIR